MSDGQAPPWKRTNPRQGRSRTLTQEQKSAARVRARKAGRRYPNLVDNMAVARSTARRARKK